MAASGSPWLVTMAASAGGVVAVRAILHQLPPTFPAAVLVVVHRPHGFESQLPAILQRVTPLPVHVATPGRPIEGGQIYVASPNAHLIVGADGRLQYMDGTRIRFVRSAANPLFETAAALADGHVIAVVLTGSGSDATDGVQAVKSFGGTVIAQDPATAEFPGMPAAAVRSGAVDFVLPIERIAPALDAIVHGRPVAAPGGEVMINLQEILCPVDFSDYSRHALDHAAAIAKWYDAKLTVMHVVAPVLPPAAVTASPIYPSIVFTPEDLEQFRVATDAFVHAEAGAMNATAVVREGSAAGEIVRFAASMPCDLLVMGTHGRSGFEHLMLGSVTERVIRKAPCPVLTVPPRAPDAVPGPVAYKRILCAIDFSPSSMKALAYAASLADEADAQLTLLHVVEHHVFEPTPMTDGPESNVVEMRDAALHRLHDSVSEEVRTWADVRELVLTGKPYREILRHARTAQAELIVLGTHGGPAGVLGFGSTTNQVIREATCPVLSLRA